MNEMMTIKQGDTRNAIEAKLRRDGQVVDLTDCHVRFLMRGIKKDIKVDDPEKGKVYVSLEKNLVESPGIYRFEFEVEYEDGRKETFPNDEYLKLKIMEGVE